MLKSTPTNWVYHFATNHALCLTITLDASSWCRIPISTLHSCDLLEDWTILTCLLAMSELYPSCSHPHINWNDHSKILHWLVLLSVRIECDSSTTHQVGVTLFLPNLKYGLHSPWVFCLLRHLQPTHLPLAHHAPYHHHTKITWKIHPQLPL